MNNRKTILWAVGIGVLLLAVAVLGVLGWWQRALNGPGAFPQPVTVVLEPGEGAAQMAHKLAAAGVVSSPAHFRLAARQLDVQNKLQAGEYSFEPGLSLRDVVGKIAKGQTVPRSLTIPEGLTVKQILALLEANTDLSGTVAQRPAEGTIFPDTYTYARYSPRQKLLDHMTTRMKEELDKAWAARNPLLPYKTPDDLLTMASIVQKEAASDAEMPQVAGVFVNRLNKGMYLQADPTVIYGMDGYEGNIRRADLSDDNPFNTYKNPGLPPTPIANPGRVALQAAANPASTTALFFVAAPGGGAHVFSDTYAQHQKAVNALVRATAPPKAKTQKPRPQTR